MNDHLLKLPRHEATELALAFEKAKLEGKGTPQEIADRNEAAVRKFFTKYFPFPFRITKGNINDSEGKRSASIDCIVLNPDHPYTVSDDDNFSVILVDGVDFAIEVKPNLTVKSELIRSLKQIKTVKELTRKRNGIIFQSKHSKEKLVNASKVPCFIFADITYKNPLTLVENIIEYYVENKVPRLKQSYFDSANLPEGLVFFK